MKPLTSSKIPSYYTVQSSSLISKKAHAFSYQSDHRQTRSGYNYRPSQVNYDPAFSHSDYEEEETEDEEIDQHQLGEYHRSKRLQTENQGEKLLYHLPLHSERVHVSRKDRNNDYAYYSNYSQEYHLSTGSQRQLRQMIDTTIDERYQKVERIIHTKLLKPVFRHWKDHYEPKSKLRQHMKYYYPIIQDQHSKEWYQHRACTIIIKYLFFNYSLHLQKGFHHWKCITKQDYWMKRHFYDKWMIKTSIYKLARLTARRFVTILYPIAKKYYQFLYLHHWKLMIERWKHYRFLRMIFRIWKLSIFAWKKYKKQQCRRALGKLIANVTFYHQRDQLKIQYLTNKTISKLLYTTFEFWKQLRQKKSILRKFIILITKKRMFLRCWNQWKSILPPKVKLLPENPGLSSPKYSPREPSSPSKTFIRAVYQNPTSKNEYREVTVSKKKKKGKGLTKLDWRHMTALERLEYRLRYVKHMDSEFLRLEHMRHEVFQASLENVSFQNHQPISITSSQEREENRESNRQSLPRSSGGGGAGAGSVPLDPRNNVLCRHSHDNCLYCNYCYRNDDESSTSTMANYLEEKYGERRFTNKLSSSSIPTKPVKTAHGGGGGGGGVKINK